MPRAFPWRLLLVPGALAVLACDSATAGDSTGLQGLVTLGPVTPVCMPDVSCDQPVQASLRVYQGTRVLRTFASDVRGLYTVTLPPGTYTIAPLQGGPIPFPEAQRLTVRVERGPGPTSVDLRFSSGLR